MKSKWTIVGSMVAVAVLALAVGLARAQGPQPPGEGLQPQGGVGIQAALGTAFTYQGQLKKAGNPVNGNCDFRFSLYDDSGGPPIGVQTTTGITVTDGLFTVQLDFGAGAFQGDARWLEIAVRCAGDGDYVTLSPRQPLTPAPYALAMPGLRTQQNADSPNVIGGYSGNSVTAGVYGATIGGGGSSEHTNVVTDAFSTVGGGRGNIAGKWGATIAGGVENKAPGESSTIGGGNGNTASAYAATVSGGGANIASADGATVGGGMQNNSSGGQATIGGGVDNTASGYAATIGGGESNLITATATYGTIAGGYNITVTGQYAAVGGGYGNRASGDYATVGGGWLNTADGYHATVGGGQGNTATNLFATVGGGWSNTASDRYATVGGGWENTASGYAPTVGGGYFNTSTGWAATVGGGYSNAASGNYATVPGGAENTAQGYYSFAAGRRAKANHPGAFVWADSTDADFASTAANQFAVRATGGVSFTTGSNNDFLLNGNRVWNEGNDGHNSGLDADTVDGYHASAFASASLLGSSWVYEANTTRDTLFSMSTTGWAVLDDGDTDWDCTLIITTTSSTPVEYTLWYGSTVVHGEASSGSPATITHPHYQGFQLILARHQYIASLVCNENDGYVACVYQKSHP